MFIASVSPSHFQDLRKPPSPRQRWKAEHHARRFERRYGRPPTEFYGQVGQWQGVRIISNAGGCT